MLQDTESTCLMLRPTFSDANRLRSVLFEAGDDVVDVHNGFLHMTLAKHLSDEESRNITQALVEGAVDFEPIVLQATGVESHSNKRTSFVTVGLTPATDESAHSLQQLYDCLQQTFPEKRIEPLDQLHITVYKYHGDNAAVNILRGNPKGGKKLNAERIAKKITESGVLVGMTLAVDQCEVTIRGAANYEEVTYEDEQCEIRGRVCYFDHGTQKFIKGEKEATTPTDYQSMNPGRRNASWRKPLAAANHQNSTGAWRKPSAAINHQNSKDAWRKPLAAANHQNSKGAWRKLSAATDHQNKSDTWRKPLAAANRQNSKGA